MPRRLLPVGTGNYSKVPLLVFCFSSGFQGNGGSTFLLWPRTWWEKSWTGSRRRTGRPPSPRAVFARPSAWSSALWRAGRPLAGFSDVGAGRGEGEILWQKPLGGQLAGREAISRMEHGRRDDRPARRLELKMKPGGLKHKMNATLAILGENNSRTWATPVLDDPTWGNTYAEPSAI